MKLIGTGHWAKVYLLPCNDRVRIHSEDWAKEAMGAGMYPEHRLFAKVERVAPEVYEMRYFPRVRSLKNTLCSHDYKLYQILRGWLDRKSTGYYFDQIELCDNIISEYPEFTDEMEAIKGAFDALADYHERIGFEISPRNVAVDGDKLVLLDCFYFPTRLKFKWSN